MAVKTFTDNTALPASDINTFLANSGLVYVTNATLSGSAVQINNCFTSTYAAYRLVFTNLTFSAGDNLTVRLVAGTTPNTSLNYYSSRLSVNSAGGVVGAASYAVDYWLPHVIGRTVAGGGIIDIYNPQLTVATQFQGGGSDSATTGDALRLAGGYFNGSTSFSGIWLSTLSGSASMAGLVTIYGYRLG